MSDNAPSPYQVFQVQPTSIASGKAAQPLARSDIINASLQVVAQGGENNLHAHTGTDEIWLVVGGEATFYGEGDKVIAVLPPLGGLLIPRGAPYWFESTGPTPLEILRFGAIKENVVAERIDYTPQPETIRRLRAELRTTAEGLTHVPAG